MKSDYLKIYLADHSAMMTAEIELIQRCRGSNASLDQYHDLVEYLGELGRHVEAEQDVIRQILHKLGRRPAVLKELSGWVVEKIGRLKFNGQLTKYSELSRVMELELLASTAQSRAAMWKTLTWLDREISDVVGENYVERCEVQVQELEKFHDQAVKDAFGQLAAM